MRNESEKLVACPISCSSNNDQYNDLCKATGKPCPYFIDEGMSVCKSKSKCLSYFMKKGAGVNWREVAKLMASDTKSYKGRRKKYTNTIERSKHMDREMSVETATDAREFLEGLDDALKNHSETSAENPQKETLPKAQMSAIEMYKKKK